MFITNIKIDLDLDQIVKDFEEFGEVYEKKSKRTSYAMAICGLLELAVIIPYLVFVGFNIWAVVIVLAIGGAVYMLEGMTTPHYPSTVGGAKLTGYRTPREIGLFMCHNKTLSSISNKDLLRQLLDSGLLACVCNLCDLIDTLLGGDVIVYYDEEDVSVSVLSKDGSIDLLDYSVVHLMPEIDGPMMLRITKDAAVIMPVATGGIPAMIETP